MKFAAIKNLLNKLFNQHKNKQVLILIIAFTLSNIVAANTTATDSNNYQPNAANSSHKKQHIQKNSKQTNRHYQFSVDKLQLKNALQYNIYITINEPNLIANKSVIMARASTLNNGINSNANIQEVTRIKANQWLLELQDDGLSSSYKIEFEFKGIDVNNNKYEYSSKPLIIEPIRLPAPVVASYITTTPSSSNALNNTNKASIKTIASPKIPVVHKQQAFLLLQVITAILVIIIFASPIFLLVFFKRSQQPLKNQSKNIIENKTAASPE